MFHSKNSFSVNPILQRVTVPVVVAFLLMTGGCSTYKTNTKLTFTSTVLNNQKPVIHVGEITETPDQLTFLGSVVATVRRPSMFDADPTKEQADIVLGFQGKKMDADAVIHVTYKQSLTGGRIDATGQAVKINGPHSYNLQKNSVQKALEKFGITPDELTPQAAPPSVVPSLTAQSIVPSLAPPPPGPVITGPQSVTDEKVYALARALADAEAKAQAQVETARANEEFRQLEAEADINAINIMMSSAKTLQDYASKYHDETMNNIISRLIQNLEHHAKKHEREAAP